MRIPPARNIAVLISGRGSNLRAILQAKDELKGEIKVVLANKEGAGGLSFAREFGIPTEFVPHRDFADRDLYDARLVEVLKSYDVEIVVLAGFMRVLGSGFLAAFPNRVMNIHPSILPSFPGIDAQAQAFDYGAKVSGCTVHLVDEGTDSGPIIDQAVVPVLPDDDQDSLADRILHQEHRILPRAIQWMVEGRLELQGRKVIVHQV